MPKIAILTSQRNKQNNGRHYSLTVGYLENGELNDEEIFSGSAAKLNTALYKRKNDPGKTPEIFTTQLIEEINEEINPCTREANKKRGRTGNNHQGISVATSKALLASNGIAIPKLDALDLQPKMIKKRFKA